MGSRSLIAKTRLLAVRDGLTADGEGVSLVTD
jgi:hypothetical protein